MSEETQRFVHEVEEYSGDVDTLIATWDECFDRAHTELPKPRLLGLMDVYSDILVQNGYWDRAGSVDRVIQDILLKDAEGELDEVDEETRDALIQYIKDRWNNGPRSPNVVVYEDHGAEEDGSSKETFAEIIHDRRGNVPAPLMESSNGLLPKAGVSPCSNINSSIPEIRVYGGLEPSPSSSGSETRLLQLNNSSSTSPAANLEDTSSQDVIDGYWFSNLKEQTHKLIYGHRGQFAGVEAPGGTRYRPVKVAILDSGFRRKSMRSFLVNVQDQLDFVTGAANVEDKADHGTTVARILLKTCPTAHVYIAKVTIDADGTKADSDKPENNMGVSKTAVANAIRHAADPSGWGVDIINMSFGWAFDDDQSIRDALTYAKAKNVLLFASATNHGLVATNSVQFPGRAPEVICVDAALTLGRAADSAIADIHDQGIERFSAPGYGHKSPISGGIKDGSSFASPIAAGIAALVLEFARQFPLCNSQNVQGSLRRREGMVRILRDMSKQEHGATSKFLLPWTLLGKGSTNKISEGGQNRMRDHTAMGIILALRKEFGDYVDLLDY